MRRTQITGAAGDQKSRNSDIRTRRTIAAVLRKSIGSIRGFPFPWFEFPNQFLDRLARPFLDRLAKSISGSLGSPVFGSPGEPISGSPGALISGSHGELISGSPDTLDGRQFLSNRY